MLCIALLCLALLRFSSSSRQRPNVILILADDLGYGDLGWGPYIGHGDSRFISTPNLQRMADAGVVMTNFHTASPVCSPARASIMLGLFPWRVGVDFIYAGDLKKDGSYELDHEQLPLIPNIAMSFRDAGYYTAHIGKWHLGGTAPSDVRGRRASNCTVPGINQYGFDEYVGMTEGCPDGSRCKTHQHFNTYSTGSQYLIKNDFTGVSDYWVDDKKKDKVKILTDKQTDEAMRVVREQTKLGQRFFLNLWFDAPHSPWEAIEPYFAEYSSKAFASLQMHKYASMVSNMDMNIGRLLDLLDELGIAESTLIMFTSDNGPENGAGSAGRFKGRKRQLSEGGLRVPAIWHWKGVLKPSVNDKFALSTDLFPTFLHAARIKVPPHVRLDGVSLLPALLQRAREQHGDERMVLFYVRTVGFPKLAAAWSNGYKLMWNDYEGRTGKALPPALRLFDMRSDPYEDTNLIPLLEPLCDTYARGTPEPRWSDFAVSNRTFSSLPRADRLALIGLMQHLHISAHLFRHQGEKAWHHYHNNRPYEAHPSCHVRTSQERTLDWGGHVLAPEFCGDSVYRDTGPPLCRCSFHKSNCSDYWTQPRGHGWTQGTLQRGLDALSSPSRGGLQKKLQEMMRDTRYKPVCPKAGLVAAPSRARGSADAAAARAEAACHDEGANDGWALGDVVDGTLWTRGCHQRVRARGKGTYTAGASCGNDRPLLVLNNRGMPHPLLLCPDSLSKLSTDVSAADRYIDDNVMMIALYDSFSALLKRVAIVDPLFLHMASAKPEPSLAVLTGFFDVWESRLAAGLLTHVVMPVYESYAWSVAVLSMRGSSRVEMVYYSPHSGGGNDYRREALVTALRRVLGSTAFAGGRMVRVELAVSEAVTRPCTGGKRSSGACVLQYLQQMVDSRMRGGGAAAVSDSPDKVFSTLHARLQAQAKVYLGAERAYLVQQSRDLFNLAK